MPSPFPGMNPWLEHADAWHDFHQRFPAAFARVLAPQLGNRYITKIDTEVYIDLLTEPDIAAMAGVVTTRHRTITPAYSTVPTTIDEVRVPFLKIEDTKERRVVTVVELLSSSNKLDRENRAV